MSQRGNTPSSARDWRPFLASWRSIGTAIKKGTPVVSPAGRHFLVRGQLPPGRQLDHTLPRTRAECVNAERVCLRIECRQNNYAVEPASRQGRPREDPVNARTTLIDLRRLDQPSCALDVASQHPEGLSCEAVSRILGLSRRRIEQISALGAGLIELETRRDAELAEDLGFDDEDLTLRKAPEKERVTQVRTPHPATVPFSSVTLAVKLGDREASLVLDGDQSTQLLRILRQSNVGCLRGLARTIRDELTKPDGEP